MALIFSLFNIQSWKVFWGFDNIEGIQLRAGTPEPFLFLLYFLIEKCPLDSLHFFIMSTISNVDSFAFTDELTRVVVNFVAYDYFFEILAKLLTLFERGGSV